MADEYTPLEAAAMKYTVKRAPQIEAPSSNTLSTVIYDAFIEGAIWAVKNPILTKDLQRSYANASESRT